MTIKVIITVSTSSRSLEERFNMVSKSIKKDSNWTSRDENHNAWNEKCIGCD